MSSAHPLNRRYSQRINKMHDEKCSAFMEMGLNEKARNRRMHARIEISALEEWNAIKYPRRKRQMKLNAIGEHGERYKFASISTNIWHKPKTRDPKSTYKIGWDGRKNHLTLQPL